MSAERTAAVFVMSVAASICGTHPQTLRAYERLGFVLPARTTAGARMYSQADIDVLLRVVHLSAAGVSLLGIRHILTLEAENVRLREELERCTTKMQ